MKMQIEKLAGCFQNPERVLGSEGRTRSLGRQQRAELGAVV